MSDFQQVLQHELHERRVNRFYVLALFAAIFVVVAALMEGFGVWADGEAAREFFCSVATRNAELGGVSVVVAALVGQLYFTEIASSASSSNDIC